MRIIFGILSLSVATGLLVLHIVPVVRQVLIPYWRQGESGFLQIQFGPFSLREPQFCILEAVLAVFVMVLIVAGIYAFTTRDTAA